MLERIELNEDAGVVIAHVRPKARWRRRCGRCGRRCAGYDTGEGRRRWRSLDLGTVKVFLEADAPRVACGEHSVVVAQVASVSAQTGYQTNTIVYGPGSYRFTDYARAGIPLNLTVIGVVTAMTVIN